VLYWSKLHGMCTAVIMHGFQYIVAGGNTVVGLVRNINSVIFSGAISNFCDLISRYRIVPQPQITVTETAFNFVPWIDDVAEREPSPTLSKHKTLTQQQKHHLSSSLSIAVASNRFVSAFIAFEASRAPRLLQIHKLQPWLSHQFRQGCLFIILEVIRAPP